MTPDRRQFANYRFIGADYFRTMGIPLASGREFSQSDDERARAVAIVSSTFAQRYLADVQPLGANLLVNDSDVGPRDVAVRSSLLKAEPDAALTPRAMDDVLIASLAVRRFQTALMTAFAVFATLLAGIGFYSVMSYLSAQRTREIGVRMALGATAPSAAGLVVQQGLAYAGLGVLAGTGLVLAGYRVIASSLYMTRVFDVATLAWSAALVFMTTAFASWLPAIRAARVDPAVVLRQE